MRLGFEKYRAYTSIDHANGSGSGGGSGDPRGAGWGHELSIVKAVTQDSGGGDNAQQVAGGGFSFRPPENTGYLLLLEATMER